MGKSWCDKSDEGKIVILQRTLKTFRFLWSEGRPVFDTGIQGALFQANEPATADLLSRAEARARLSIVGGGRGMGRLMARPFPASLELRAWLPPGQLLP